MRKVLIFKKLKENVRSGIVTLACVFMIILLTGACAGTSKMQIASNVNATDQVTDQAPVKGVSEKSEISDDQTIVCRRKAPTGSRLKKKICKTKAQWAREAGAGNKNAGDLQKDVDQNLSRNTGAGADVMGGSFPGASVPR